MRPIDKKSSKRGSLVLEVIKSGKYQQFTFPEGDAWFILKCCDCNSLLTIEEYGETHFELKQVKINRFGLSCGCKKFTNKSIF